MHFGAERGVTTKIEPASGGEFTSYAANNLCAIEFRLTPAPGQPYMALAIEEISGSYVEIDPMPASLRGGQALSEPLTWRINLPLRMKVPLEYRMHLVSAEREIAGEAYKTLKVGDFTAAGQSGMSITIAHHTVSP